MAVISEVKCGRCDRRYSGFRSRCPYCGARRNKRGKHADDTENARAKLIIGVLLLVVLVAATMVLIFTSLPDKAAADAKTSDSPVSADISPAYTDDEDDNTALPGTEDVSPTTPAEESASPSIDANVTVATVAITYQGTPKSDVTMNVGESLAFSFVTTPASTGKVAIWDEDKNNSVITVVNGKVTAMAKGTATLKVTVDNITATCIIRVKSK
jgi:uncharacterized protein YjdB